MNDNTIIRIKVPARLYESVKAKLMIKENFEAPVKEEEKELEEIDSTSIAALIGLIPGITLTAALIKDIVKYMKSKGLKGIDGFKQAYKAVGADASAHMDKTVGGNRPGQGHGAEILREAKKSAEDKKKKEAEAKKVADKKAADKKKAAEKKK
jgi:hypothetical protein